MVYVAGMPDLHPGKGSPVGAAFISEDFIHPDLVGGDIGCGMLFAKTSIEARVGNLEKRERRLGSIDAPFEGDISSLLARYELPTTGYEGSLGTIGGGNHFAELQVIHKIVDAEIAAQIGLDIKLAHVLVHSGSRGFGQQVLHDFRKETPVLGTPALAESDAGQQYLAGHDTAVRFAKANRELIAERFTSGLGGEMSRLLDISHNFVDSKHVDGKELWVHRKGAAPTDQGLVVVPGSRGSYSYLVAPLGDGKMNAYSLAHGAGRKIPRSQCKDKFRDSYTLEDLSRINNKDLGIKNRLICGDRELLYQEHSKAYKDIEKVIGDMETLGMLKVVAIMKPILTYKTTGLSEDGDG